MVETVTNKDFFVVILKLGMLFFVCYPWTTAWNEWKVLLDAEISNFDWFYCNLIPLTVREIAPFDCGFRQLVLAFVCDNL